VAKAGKQNPANKGMRAIRKYCILILFLLYIGEAFRGFFLTKSKTLTEMSFM
jgi:hypothetical protein